MISAVACIAASPLTCIRFLSIAIFAVAVNITCFADTRANSSPFVCERTSVRLAVRLGDVQAATMFRLRNTSDAYVAGYTVTSDCSCVNSKYEDKPIAPNGALDVHVLVDIAPGKTSLRHTLLVNLVDHEPLTLNLHVEALPEIVARPQFLIFEGAGEREVKIAIESVGARAIENIKVVRKPDFVDVKVTGASNGPVIIKIPGGARHGIYVIELSVFKSGGVSENLSIPITLRGTMSSNRAGDRISAGQQKMK